MIIQNCYTSAWNCKTYFWEGLWKCKWAIIRSSLIVTDCHVNVKYNFSLIQQSSKLTSSHDDAVLLSRLPDPWYTICPGPPRPVRRVLHGPPVCLQPLHLRDCLLPHPHHHNTVSAAERHSLEKGCFISLSDNINGFCFLHWSLRSDGDIFWG